MNLDKPKRKVDRKLLETVRRLPCLACVSLGWCPEEIPASETISHPHHVTSVKAGGGDTWDNVIPLCQVHHREWHDRGGQFMWERYQSVFEWLLGACRSDVLDRASKNQPRSDK